LYLLYVDESGSVPDPAQQYFVLAEACVFERQTHWIEQGLDDVARRFNNENPNAIDLHGSSMRSGREGWKAYPLADRSNSLCKRGLKNINISAMVAFGCLRQLLKSQRYPAKTRLFTHLNNWSAASTYS